MKLKHVVLLSALGMSLSAAAAYSFTPQAPITAEPQSTSQENTGSSIETPDSPQEATASFKAGTTLTVEGRLGHATIASGTTKTTYVLLEVNAALGSSAKPVESHLAIVIDRSGSMKDGRLTNAINAATTAVERLGEGDRVSVIAFDTNTTVVVPMTTVSSANRAGIESTIRTISLGGDTCISCGMNAGLAELDQSFGVADRMIILSDGDATAGIRDVTSFELLARKARERGASVTTIGVGTSYNQKILGAIALHSGGGHYFVEDTSSLDRIFTSEADKLRATVALNATATITLPEGITAERVFDRAFTRNGREISVPLGNFSTGDTKTVLMELRVPTTVGGTMPIADVKLAYDDRIADKPASCEGKLAALVTNDASAVSDLDPFVGARLARSKTASVLLEANELVEKGLVTEAQDKLQAHEKDLAAAEAKAQAAAPAPKREALRNEYEGQSKTVTGARDEIGKKGNAGRAVRKNVEAANPYML